MIAKSVSVQNLENLVKQMVNGALRDNEQLIKFHRMIYEERYFKNLSESRGTKCEANETKPPQIDDQNISTTVGYRRSRRYKYKRRNSRSSTTINSITDTTVKSHSNICHGNNFSPSNSCNDKKCLNLNDPDSRNVDEIEFVSNDSVNQLDQLSDRKVIEIWSNSTKSSEKNHSTDGKKGTIEDTRVCGCDNGSRRKQENRVNLSFETWKRRKTIAYRQVLVRREKEKQQLLLANLANIKRKRVVEQEQARKKQQRSLTLSKKRLDAIKRATIVIPNRKKGDGNDGPRKRADMKFDTQRMSTITTRKPNNTNADRKDKTSWIQFMEGIAFDSWLNQLNWVLHEKYLRERRHLVRSFYCQPVYYGSTACAR